MRSKPSSCDGCACHGHGNDFSAIEGTGSSHVMLVGEASGEHEQRDQLPFRPFAPAGGVLERVLRRMSLDRQQLSVTNVVRCRPRNNWLEGAPYEYAAINHCRPNLDAAIAERRPRCIVALGGTATRALTGLAGEALGVNHLAGYVLPSQQTKLVYDTDAAAANRSDMVKVLEEVTAPGAIMTDWPARQTFHNVPTPVIANFHPAYLRRGKASHQGVFARILQRAVNIAAGRDRQWTWGVVPEDHLTWDYLRYQVKPSVADAAAFYFHLRDNANVAFSYDIETAESASIDEDAREGFADTQIQLVQFSAGAGTAIALPWEGDFKRIVQSILHLPNVKMGHNVWLFDNKVLAACGDREGLDLRPRGVVHDTLCMFHHWQPDLPAHLQFAASFVQFPFPWKHLAATDIEFYGCCDVDATLRLYNMLEATLARDGLLGDATGGYLGQVAAVRPVLADMERRGLPIDDAERRSLDAEFDRAQRELGREIAGLAPAECRRVHPKQGYKGVPPEVKAWLAAHEYEEGVADAPATKAVVLEHHVTFTDPGDDPETYRYAQRTFAVAVEDAATGAPVSVPTLRWCRVYDFNPNSSQQLIAYMRAKGVTPPKSRKNEDADGNAKDTTEKKELVRLAHKTGDTFYLKVIEFREFSKMRGTYIAGFVPGPDGRVHPSFTFDTGTGQLSARNPNVTNFPKRMRLAQRIRKMVAAPTRHLLVEWDYKSYHVLTTGFLAEDAAYMRLARLDMHSFVAWHMLGLAGADALAGLPDDELAAHLKWFKGDPKRKWVRDNQSKPAILGIGFGMGHRRLYQENMEYFEGEKQAKRLHDLLKSLFPRVFAWQQRIRRQAHEQQFLRSPFGHIRRFYEVFRWDTRKGDWAPGDQAEEAVAFLPANIAFGNMRETMKALAAGGHDARWGLCNSIHDSFLFCFPETLSSLADHVAAVYPVLHAPSTVLRHPVICPGGLVVDVEAQAGHDWAEMHEINLSPAAAPVLQSAATTTTEAPC